MQNAIGHFLHVLKEEKLSAVGLKPN